MFYSPSSPSCPYSSIYPSSPGPPSGQVVIEEETYPIITLIAPSGVTKIAGAKVYAAKLATDH
jgi:hypothetical protein